MDKKSTIEFLSALEGYHNLLKTIHWSATNHFEHTLTDDIDEDVLGYEDRIAEAVMGKLNIRFGVGDLKTLMPEAKTLDTLLKELESDILKFKENVGDEPNNGGVINILDDFLEKVNTWNYLRTLK